ncbi:MAG: hypothetical protein ACRDXX_16020 [Stackebrandtia sp.]
MRAKVSSSPNGYPGDGRAKLEISALMNATVAAFVRNELAATAEISRAQAAYLGHADADRRPGQAADRRVDRDARRTAGKALTLDSSSLDSAG